jgi:hypothetical protein
MKYKIDIFMHPGEEERPDLWGWSILDQYEDEVAYQQTMFEDEQECRKEARLALSDWQD